MYESLGYRQSSGLLLQQHPYILEYPIVNPHVFGAKVQVYDDGRCGTVT